MVIKSRGMRWRGHVACMGKIRNAYYILVVNLKGMTPLGRPQHRWEDNIRMKLREIGCGDVDWMHLSQDRDQWWACVNMVMILWVP
jgi:hypothetical protein